MFLQCQEGASGVKLHITNCWTGLIDAVLLMQGGLVLKVGTTVHHPLMATSAATRRRHAHSQNCALGTASTKHDWSPWHNPTIISEKISWQMNERQDKPVSYFQCFQPQRRGKGIVYEKMWWLFFLPTSIRLKKCDPHFFPPCSTKGELNNILIIVS